MTWLQIDVLELLFESARHGLVSLKRSTDARAMTAEEVRATRAAQRHLERIRQPHALSSCGARSFNHLI